MPTNRRELTFADILENPALIQEMTKEEIATAYIQINHYIEEVEAAKKALNKELWDRMDTDSDVISGLNCSKVTQIRFSTKIEDARNLGAIITKEAVDTKMLKTMHESGVEVPGTVEIKFVSVKEPKS